MTKKFTAEKRINLVWSLKLQKKLLALKREHPALQNMNFFNFFLFLWVIFALLDPDPDPDSESGYVSTDLIGSGSETLPGAQPLPTVKDWTVHMMFKLGHLFGISSC
jgi:hypothetical protein